MFSSDRETPVSTDYIIVFPLIAGKKFSRSTYSPIMTQGRASSGDINHVLKLFEMALSKGDLWKSVFWRFVLPFVVLMYLFSERMFYDEGAISTGFFMYCCIGLVYVLHDRSEQIKKAKMDREVILQAIQPGYLKRGLRWRIPKDSCNWIELIKEYRETEKISAVQSLENAAKPLQNVPQEVKIMSTSYPPIYTVGLSSQ